MLLREAQAARDLLDALQAEGDRRRVEFHQAVRRLHSAGPSMREIAEALGLSHQRVHQIVSGGEEMPTSTRRRSLLNRLVRRGPRRCEPAGPGTDHFLTDHFLTDHFLVDAREAMSFAQEEARALGHNYLGTEHLLLGLLRTEHGLAARLLRSVGADLEQSRAAVRRLLGSTPPAPADTLSATPRLKKVLELARLEANSLQSPHVRTEHLLLGLAREGGGLGARILADLGVGYDHVRGRVNRAWLACSFCGRSGYDVAHLVAGPGVYICERCVEAAGHVGGPGERQAGASLTAVSADHPSSVCSFCGKKRADVDRLITAGPRASICGDCLTLCQDIVEEQRDAFVPGRG